jgi:hypothetical protein
MKKNTTIILMLLLVLSKHLYPQKEWAPLGTTWHYNYSDQMSVGYVKVESEKDTIIENKQCKYLYITKSVYEWPNTYKTYKIDSLITYQNSSKIYLYIKGKFVQLYDFNPSVGDIWETNEIPNYFNYISANSTSDACPSGKVIVDSIKTININNEALKAIYTSPYNLSKIYFNRVIVENIGCLDYMLPNNLCFSIVDIPRPSNIRCYDSKDFKYSWSDRVCDYITNVKNIESNNEISVYYNSSECELNINIEQNSIAYPVNVKIYSLNGINLFNKDIPNKEFKISAKNFLSRGMYLIVIKDNSLFSFHSKFIIQ